MSEDKGQERERVGVSLTLASILHKRPVFSTEGMPAEPPSDPIFMLQCLFCLAPVCPGPHHHSPAAATFPLLMTFTLSGWAGVTFC